MNTPPPLVTKYRIKRFGPLQLGKILALLYGAMGLIVMPIFLLMSLLSPALPPGQRAGMMVMGVGLAFAMPIFYAGMGFITGVLGALLYNVGARWIGGIEVEVE